MIYFDTTKTGRTGQRSGLMRVSARLREGLGSSATEVIWDGGLREAQSGKKIAPRPADTFLTSELFSPAERPAFADLLAAHPCRFTVIFHDAIPLQHPHITWPQSVARHPAYMKMLAAFDHVWAVSETSRRDLTGFWRWQGVDRVPAVDVLSLGADFNGTPRITRRPTPSPSLLCLGIIEPRKNQIFLLEVCSDLWSEGERFDLHIVGRVNPHFGGPIVKQIKTLQRTHRTSLHFHEAAGDAVVAQLFSTARATVFPTIAEGCGLPLLESLWMGTPCVCSDLPVLRENADGGGCLPVTLNDRAAWKKAFRRILKDDALHRRLSTEATTRPLPTWKKAAEALKARLVPSDLSSPA